MNIRKHRTAKILYRASYAIFKTYIQMINNYTTKSDYKSDSKKNLTFLSYIYDKIYNSFN